jgi:UDP-N-acetylmuramyl tripeptide synthase
MLLNSADADGRDTSWIWDARFEDRALPAPLFVSGRRVWDMALRLRYAGRASGTLRADEDAGRMLSEALAACPPGKALYVLPNYTAMLELRAGALRQYGVTVFGEGGDPA